MKKCPELYRGVLVGSWHQPAIPIGGGHCRHLLEMLPCPADIRQNQVSEWQSIASVGGQQPACPHGYEHHPHSWEGAGLGARKVLLCASNQMKTDGMLLHLSCNSDFPRWLCRWCYSFLNSPSPFLETRPMPSLQSIALGCAVCRKEGSFTSKGCFPWLMYPTCIQQSSCLYSGRWLTPISLINTLQSQQWPFPAAKGADGSK